jgi:hypothetical protein
MFKRILIFMAIAFLPAIIASAQTDQAPAAPPANITVEPVLCTAVEDHMPVGEADAFPADVDRVYLWTKVTGVTDGEMMIHHVWLREGKEMADVELPVKGSPWRTYSYKTIPPEWAGNWEVKITGPDGNVIKAVTFTVGGQLQQETPAPEKTEGQ